MTIAEDILDLARWAPSGDNSQPWRFVIRSDREIDVLGYDTRAHCVYDLDGRASHIAHGMLLETIAVAASEHGYRTGFSIPDRADTAPVVYRVALEHDASLAPDPLARAITSRTVQRRPMRPRPLSTVERSTLEHSAQPLAFTWFESWTARRQMAALCARNARIRMTIPEAYAAHRAVIEWHATTSEDRMPDSSLGAGPLLLAVMRRAMTSWQRLDRLNRLTGTLMARLALDYLPGILCSGHFALTTGAASDTLGDRVAAGRAIQRVWLTATSLGLQLQPEFTPLVFARYAREGRRFTSSARAQREAEAISRDLAATVGITHVERIVWLARIGPERPVAGRSLRLPLSKLVVTEAPTMQRPLASQAADR